MLNVALTGIGSLLYLASVLFALLMTWAERSRAMPVGFRYTLLSTAACIAWPVTSLIVLFSIVFAKVRQVQSSAKGAVASRCRIRRT